MVGEEGKYKKIIIKTNRRHRHRRPITTSLYCRVGPHPRRSVRVRMSTAAKLSTRVDPSSVSSRVTDSGRSCKGGRLGGRMQETGAADWQSGSDDAVRVSGKSGVSASSLPGLADCHLPRRPPLLTSGSTSSAFLTIVASASEPYATRPVLQAGRQAAAGGGSLIPARKSHRTTQQHPLYYSAATGGGQRTK
jgi:hypothetical protein